MADPGVFFDSNIWLYAFTARPDEAEKCRIARALVRKGNVFVSTQVINEVCVNLLKKGGFTEAQVVLLVQAFYRSFRVVDLSESVLIEASALRQRFSLNYWDSLIMASAEACKASVLFTEDLQQGLQVSPDLIVRNPFIA